MSLAGVLARGVVLLLRHDIGYLEENSGVSSLGVRLARKVITVHGTTAGVHRRQAVKGRRHEQGPSAQALTGLATKSMAPTEEFWGPCFQTEECP